MIVQLEEEKTSRAQAQEKSASLMQEEITSHTIEALTSRAAQMREKGKELA
jgi:hypothetical protein